MSARLLAGLAWHAARWHAGMAPVRIRYWLRPYCWRLDACHSRWAHRRCACRPHPDLEALVLAALGPHRQ